MHGILLLILVGLICLRTTRRFAFARLLFATIASLLITIIPVGALLSITLEARFEKADLNRSEFAGVITLSGSIDPKQLSSARACSVPKCPGSNIYNAPNGDQIS